MSTTNGLVLDHDQQRAVRYEGRRLKLLGAPGTGKTTVLLERAAWLVGERGVEPERLLVFAEDRRQAHELRSRLVRRLGRSVAGPSVFTFHAFCWSLLGRGFPVLSPEGIGSHLGYELAGYADEPVLLTAFDQRALVKKLLADEDRSDWPVNGRLLGSSAFAGEVRDFLLRAQERLETPHSLLALARERRRDDWVELAHFFARYLRKLEDPAYFADGRPRLDFARVLAEARRVIGEHPELANDLRFLYRHVLVDDFEEANRAELAVLEALLPSDEDATRSAVVAGDPGGAVFGFRGADPSCLLGLAGDVVDLPTSYRRAGEPKVNLYSHLTEEARGVVAELRLAGADGTAWGDMAVIVRDHRQLLAPLRRELSRAGVPYRVDGESLQLAHDPVVRPVLSLFAIACEREGHEELWPALLTSELGGFAAHELVQLRRAARLQGLSLHQLCSGADVEVDDPARRKLEAVCALVAAARRWARELPPDACFWQLWQSSSWFAALVAAQDDRRLDSLTTLADALARFTERRGKEARLADFLDTLVSAEFAPESVRLDPVEDAVTIATAHATKGREFAAAVIAGCVEGMWPDPARRSLLLDVDLLAAPRAPAARQADALDEEERLFRLATTRAPRLVLTGQRAGGSERSSAEPSRFLRSYTPLPEANAAVPDLVFTAREAEIAWRRTVADAARPPSERLAALWGLAHLEDVQPSRWWWGRPWTQNETPVVGETKRTSYSRFSDYENCPLQYLMGQVLGLDPDTSYHMAFGSLVHGLLEDLEAGRLPKDLDALVEEAERRWRREAFPPGAVTAFLKRDCREILERYLRLEADNGHRTVAVERWFEFPVGEWQVRGKIDRIDRLDRNGLRLSDYKTANWAKSNSEVEDDLQLHTYFLACVRDEELRTLGAPKIAELVFVRKERGGPFGRHVARAEVHRPRDGDDGTPWDVLVEQRIAGLLDGIESEDFAPSPDAECRNCSFKTLCPLWAEGEELQVR